MIVDKNTYRLFGDLSLIFCLVFFIIWIIGSYISEIISNGFLSFLLTFVSIISIIFGYLGYKYGINSRGKIGLSLGIFEVVLIIISLLILSNIS